MDQDFSFETWFELFWNSYVPDLLHNTKGPKEGPYKERLRATKPETLEKILAALREQVRYRRKAKSMGYDKPMWCLPMVSVWVNQKRWTEEIPSQMDLNKTVEVKKITCIYCETEVKHKHTMCAKCEQYHKGEIDYKLLEKMGLYKPGDSAEKLRQACKSAFPKLLDKFRNRSLQNDTGGSGINLWPMRNAPKRHE